MDKKDFFVLGTIFKASGFEGELILSLDVDSSEKYHSLTEVYIESPEGLKKHSLTKYVLNKNKTAYISIYNYESSEAAKVFFKKEVWLPVSFLPSLSGSNFYFHEITGFDVIDSVRGSIGKVKSIIELPHQKLLQVYFDRTEILIPLLQNTIQKINRENKFLEIKTPEGLIEVYLKPNKEEKEEG